MNQTQIGFFFIALQYRGKNTASHWTAGCPLPAYAPRGAWTTYCNGKVQQPYSLIDLDSNPPTEPYVSQAPRIPCPVPRVHERSPIPILGAALSPDDISTPRQQPAATSLLRQFIVNSENNCTCSLILKHITKYLFHRRNHFRLTIKIHCVLLR